MIHVVRPNPNLTSMPSQLPARTVRACRSANVIGPAVLRLRQARGWTQEQLVARIHLRNAYVTRDIIANLETGRSSASDTLVLTLAQVFDVSPADLFPPARPGGAQPALGLHPVTASRRRRPHGSGGHCARHDFLLRQRDGASTSTT